jgi:hypothetical protein
MAAFEDRLTSGNWQRTVLDAVEALPEDIGPFVGYAVPETNRLVIKIACEPADRDVEVYLKVVIVTWWDTLRAELEALARDSPGYGIEHLYRPDDPRLDWPVLSLERESTCVTEGVFPGRVPATHLKRRTQLAILEELREGGGVFKDRAGRFVRRDGSPILDWQFTSRAQGK